MLANPPSTGLGFTQRPYPSFPEFSSLHLFFRLPIAKPGTLLFQPFTAAGQPSNFKDEQGARWIGILTATGPMRIQHEPAKALPQAVVKNG